MQFQTITLKGSPQRKEGIASADIMPGHLVEFGGDNDLQVHSTDGGIARKAFAIEWDPAKGMELPYSKDEQVMYVVAASGDEIFAFLKAGETVARNDALVSAGDGTLRKFQSGENGDSPASIVAYALDAMENSGAEAVRFAVEVA